MSRMMVLNINLKRKTSCALIEITTCVIKVQICVVTYFLTRRVCPPGQTFECIGKVFVQTSCYAKFCDRLKEKIANLRVGDALDHSNDIGATRPQYVSAIKEAMSRNTDLSVFTVR